MFFVGPQIPEILAKATLYELVTEKRILLFGGRMKWSNFISTTDNIMELNCVEDIGEDFCEWITLTQKLKIPRYGGIAVTIP